MIRARVAALTLAIPALLFAGCSSDDETSSGDTTTTAAAAEGTPSTSASTGATTTNTAPPMTLPFAGELDESGDQTAPVGTNGIVVADDGSLWIADGEGSQIIQVDTATGDIVNRWPTPDGSWPDDLAFDPDGRLFWTGFESGQIGRIDPSSGDHVIVAEVPPGANPITFTEDGRLLVGLAVTADGLYEIDPEGVTDPVQIVAELGNVNGFDVAADGYLYGPRATGEVVRIDTATGEVLDTIASDMGFSGAVREATDGSLVVLSATPTPTLWSVDIETGEKTAIAALDTQLVDNVAVGDDGSFYVTTFNRPAVIVVAPDGTTTELPIGTAS